MGFSKKAATALASLLGKNLGNVTGLLTALATIPALAVLGSVSAVATAVLKGLSAWVNAANVGEFGVLLTLYAWVLPFFTTALQPFSTVPGDFPAPPAATASGAAIAPHPVEPRAVLRRRAALATELIQTALPHVSSIDMKTMRPLEVAIKADLDPHLQAAVLRSRMGRLRRPTASAGAEEIPVIARVKDIAKWEARSEVRDAAVIGGASTHGDPTNDKIVTGRIPVKRIEAVRADPNVASLKAARPIHPALGSTVADLGIRPQIFPSLSRAGDGAGVIVGFVDFGCDFRHRNFQNPDGTTRLLALWDQSAPHTAGSPRDYGRLHLKAAIDAALGTADPYAALDYRPEPSSHGTHVMDIAAGNGRGTGIAGSAPAADLVFVECSTNRLPWDGEAAVGVSFGDSVQLLEAVQFIFEFAGNRPCVVNLSLGTNGGPHDGSTLVEQGLDALVRNRTDRAVVIAASNSQADGIHALVNVKPNTFADLEWQTPFSSSGHELEIWIPGDVKMAVELIAPDGTQLGIVEPGDQLSLGENNQVAVFISNRLQDPNNGDNFAGVFIAPELPAGTWRVRIHSRSDREIAGHAWIERNDPAQSSFVDSVATHTLGSISCGHETIAVGSFDAHKPTRPISFFSSAGPTRDGREKPEISAGGHAVLAADAGSLNGVTRKSGTSMAAPAVTGLVALMLAAAHNQGRALSITDIRNALTTAASRNPPGGAAWDPVFGFGRASAACVR